MTDGQAPAPSARVVRSPAAARTVTTAALLAALLAASALLAVPLGPVPLTLQVLVVVLAALLLTPGQAALAVGVYLLEGAIGLPVFSGMRGGLSVLAGPTGGYLWGFLGGALAGAWVRKRLAAAGSSALAADAASAAVVIGIIYALGVTQLALVAHLGAGAALLAGAVPFILPDAAKAAAAIAIASAVRQARGHGRR
jgi:biotin transport system substrate-specific component